MRQMIEITEPNGDVQRLPLAAERIVIGRSEQNTHVMIDDSRVSRVHLQIARDETGAAVITDLYSANGTKLNGKKVSSQKPVIWRLGDTVQIGSTKLVLQPDDTHTFKPVLPDDDNNAYVDQEPMTLLAMRERKQEPRFFLLRWYDKQRVILSNAFSLVGTTVATSGLGFAYWWVATQFFTQGEVGIASAAISAMMLLATVGILGMGSLLTGELARKPEQAGSLLTTALLVTGIISTVLGVAFAVIMPQLSAELRPLAVGWESVVLFAVGVAATCMGLILDQALIGLLQGHLQMWRNIVFSVLKLVALFFVGQMVAGAVGLQIYPAAADALIPDSVVQASNVVGLTIYATWVGGLLISIIMLVAILSWRGIRIVARPQFSLIRKLGRVALGHHLLNLSLKAPSLIMPILVTAMLSAELNANFYTAWMIANFTFVVPSALTTVLYAVGAADPSALADKMRFTLKASFGVGILATIGVFVMAYPVLYIFGPEYASQGDWVLRILVLGVFTQTVREHYVAICRIHKNFRRPAMLIATSGMVQMILIGAGAIVGGEQGTEVLGVTVTGLHLLTLGWLVAMSFESIFTLPTVLRALNEEIPIEPGTPTPDEEPDALKTQTEGIPAVKTS
jgi:O-antigen/teichoic acid export membrane protein